VRPADLQRHIFDRLAAASGKSLVSIYLPIQVLGDGLDQGRIRLKNGLTTAENALADIGLRTPQRVEFTKQVRGLLDDLEFWRHQGRGLGVFVDDQGTTIPVALPAGSEEITVVADTFHLRPMIPSLETVELSVLALTMHGVRLYRASRYGTDRTTVDLPRSLEDVNWFVDREKQRQQHADRAGHKGLRHGHEPSQSRQEDMERFFRAVDDAIPSSEPPEPMIVLGDDNLVARFSAISNREVLAGGHVAEVDDMSAVHDAAVKLLEEYEAALNNTLIDAAQEQLALGTAITDLTPALAAAVSGRLGQLLLKRAAGPVWGRFDPATLEVNMSEDGPLRVDLLDRLAVHAMGTGAEVKALERPVDDRDFVALPRF
jgi:hypothetical protein